MINVVRSIGNTYLDVLNKIILINVEFCCVHAQYDLEIDFWPLSLTTDGPKTTSNGSWMRENMIVAI